jgi:HPt (histidine-containing phosphotransfer) domain-containing protein
MAGSEAYPGCPVETHVELGMPGVRPIDRKHLARYTLGDTALEEEILGLFLEQLPKTIAMLRAAGTDKDWISAAHTLKGSSRCVGAWRLARTGEQAERLGGIANRRACLEALLRIEDAADEARAYILGLAPPAPDHCSPN